jgi:hypothetical protein
MILVKRTYEGSGRPEGGWRIKPDHFQQAQHSLDTKVSVEDAGYGKCSYDTLCHGIKESFDYLHVMTIWDIVSIHAGCRRYKYKYWGKVVWSTAIMCIGYLLRLITRVI